MADKSDLVPYLMVWASAMSIVVWQTWKTAGAGLMLAYSFQMLMLYWVGAAVHVLPWSELLQTDLVFLGVQQATYAVIAFAIGSLVLGPKVVDNLMKRTHEAVIPDPKLPRGYILYGACSYFILAPTLGRVSGFSAVAAVGSQLVVVGCCLNCWKAWSTGGKRALFQALAPTLIIPCVTIVVQGFIGFGVMALATIMAFCAQFFRPRWLLLVGFAVSGYVGLSVYTTYMKSRVEIREVVWGEGGLSDRVDKLIEKAQGFEFFSLTDQGHLELVDNRLNQDVLVGAAVDHLRNTDDFARGDTLREALLGMIPRIIWPDKPVQAGSGGMVTRFTGLEFASGTSVGVGPVMELYGNFGTAGVVVGFLVLGSMIKVIDVMAGLHLAMGNWHGFATYCLVGISFLNVSGSFVEVTMGALASLLLVYFVNAILRRKGKSVSLPPVDRQAQWART